MSFPLWEECKNAENQFLCVGGVINHHDNQTLIIKPHTVPEQIS